MKQNKVRKMVGIAILISIVVVLQLLGQFIHIGPASITLVLVPIVVGAAVYGAGAGAILGLAFSIVVLLQADTAFFYGMNVFGTVVTVLVKGTLCGWFAGLVYNVFSKKSILLGTFLSAIICPIVNTGVFFLGCCLFFWDSLSATGIENVPIYVITVFIGINFIAEFITNILCCPIIVRLLKAIEN